MFYGSTRIIQIAANEDSKHIVWGGSKKIYARLPLHPHRTGQFFLSVWLVVWGKGGLTNKKSGRSKAAFKEHN